MQMDIERKICKFSDRYALWVMYLPYIEEWPLGRSPGLWRQCTAKIVCRGNFAMVRDGGQPAKDSTSNSGGCNAGAIKGGGEHKGIQKFSFSELKEATNVFSHVLGRGGFGIVYKGVLHDGQDVAIKKLLISSDFPERSLDHELNIGARLHHKNVVKLLGYCLHTETEEYFLVQEYIPKGSLKRIINASGLDWPSCFQIIQGIARGLHYLHKQRILYMDLKPANILFNSKMNPVIIDFGLSVVLDGDDDEITWNSVAGTMGYIAPEKITRAKISMKSDVFSFGVILIEIITGRRVTPSSDIPEWGSLETIRALNGLFDPTLVDESKLVEINKCREVGLMCIEWDPKDRPTMAEVLELLNS